MAGGISGLGFESVKSQGFKDVVLKWTTLSNDIMAITPASEIKAVTPDYPVPPIISAPVRPYSPELNIVHTDLARIKFSSHKRPRPLNLAQLANEAAILVGDRKELTKRCLLVNDTGFIFIFEPQSRNFVIASSVTGITHAHLANSFRLLNEAGTFDFRQSLLGPLMKGAFHISDQGIPMLASATFLEETYGTVHDDPVIMTRCLRNLGKGLTSLGASPDMHVREHVTTIPSIRGMFTEGLISNVKDLTETRISFFVE